VPEAVVHGLEPVEVDEQQRDRRSLALRPRQHVVEAVPEQRSVGQAGQRVVEGGLGLLLAGVALGPLLCHHAQ
jgi:hypothetical protein